MIQDIINGENKEGLAILTTKSEECDLENDGHAILDIVTDMMETLVSTKKGVGLSANQIGVHKRIFVLKKGQHRVFINPEILLYRGSQKSSEGCLSYPNSEEIMVKRAKTVKVRFYDIKGKVRIVTFKGMAAIIIQHEMDHQDGIFI